MLSLSQCSEPAKRQLSLKDNLLNSATVSLDLIQPQQNAGDHLWVRNMPFVCGHFSHQKFVGGNVKQLGVYLLPKVLLQPVLLLCEVEDACSSITCSFQGAKKHGPSCTWLSPEAVTGHAKLLSLGCHHEITLTARLAANHPLLVK